MIKRIVKLSIREEEVATYIKHFNAHKQKIRAFKGCGHMEMWRSIQEENVFFTYSIWESEAALNNYRHSDLFKGIWSNVKPLFKEKAAAWSVDNFS